MVNKLSRALIYKSCNKYFWRKRKEFTNFQKTKVELPDVYKHTLIRTPTQYFRVFIHVISGLKLSTIPPHPIKKGTTKRERKKNPSHPPIT